MKVLYLVIVVIFCFQNEGFTQLRTYTELSRDTIVTTKKFLRNEHYLGGKKMNLTVMKWFMKDDTGNLNERSAHKTISFAITADGIYTILMTYGVIMGTVGVITLRDQTAREYGFPQTFLVAGGLSIGAGILSKYIGLKLERKAVRKYNKFILDSGQYHKDTPKLGFSSTGLGIQLQF